MERLIWKLLLLALVVPGVLCMSSCYTKKQALRKFGSKLETSDSLQLKTTTSSSSNLKDSVSVIPATSLEVNINPCDSLGRVKENLNLSLKSGTGKLTIRSDAGRILIKANCDSVVNRYRHELHLKDSAIERLSSKKEVITHPPEVVEVLPWWAKGLIIVLAILSLPTVLKLFRLW